MKTYMITDQQLRSVCRAVGSALAEATKNPDHAPLVARAMEVAVLKLNLPHLNSTPSDQGLVTPMVDTADDLDKLMAADVVAARDVDMRKLIAHIDRVEELFASTLEWTDKYDQIFGIGKNAIKVLQEKLELRFDWYDPDTTYEEDTTSFVLALRELKGRIQQMLPRQT